MAAQDDPIKDFVGHQGCVYDIAVSPNGKLLASVGKDNTARLWDIETGKLLQTFTGNGKELFSVCFNEKGNSIIAGGLDGDILYADIKSGKTIFKKRYFTAPVVRGVAPGYGNVDFFSTDWESVSVYYKDDKIPPKHIKFNEVGVDFIFSMKNIGKTNFLMIAYQRGLAVVDTESANLVKLPGSDLSYTCAASPDGKMVLGGMFTINAYDTTDFRKQYGYEDFDPDTTASRFFCSDFSPNGTYFIGGYDTGEIIIWEAKSRLLIARYFAHDNFGCSSSSKAAENRFFNVKSGLNAIKFLPDSKRFITCGNSGAIKMWAISKLIPAAYNEENLKKPLEITITMPATVRSVNDDQYWIKIEGHLNNTIGKATLKINGESVYVDANNKFLNAIVPQPGENKIVVEAADKRSTATTTFYVMQPNEKEVQGPSIYKKPKDTRSQEKAAEPLTVESLKIPTIYAVIVGVSNYKYHPEHNLKYAAKDAKAFYDFMRSPAGGSVPEQSIAFLCDSTATRLNVLAAINQKLSYAQKEDVFIFYYSGHGEIYGNYDDLCFLSYDSEMKNKYDLGNSSVRQSDIVLEMQKARTKKKILFVDACHSGLLAYNGEKGSGDISSKLLKEMARTIRTTAIFTSSANNENSYEDEALDGGHGIFSYYMLQGLKGNADQVYPGNEDGFVNVNELYRYINDQVSRRAKFIGKIQTPDLGNDSSLNFPLSMTIVKKKAKAKGKKKK